MFNIREDTVKKAKEGDKNSLEKLYKDNVDSLYRYVLHRLSNREVAKDIVSESFLKAFEKIDKFKEMSSFKSWLYSISNNLIIDYYRRNDKLNFNDESEDFFVGLMDVDTQVDGDSKEKLVKRINFILGELKDKYKEVLELRFIGGMTVKETSMIMKISENNVKVIQNRALKKARKLLSENKNYEI